MITVYSKPDCMLCRMTYKAMDAKGLAYQVVDVTENAHALEYVKELGTSPPPSSSSPSTTTGRIPT